MVDGGDQLPEASFLLNAVGNVAEDRVRRAISGTIFGRAGVDRPDADRDDRDQPEGKPETDWPKVFHARKVHALGIGGITDR